MTSGLFGPACAESRLQAPGDLVAQRARLNDVQRDAGLGGGAGAGAAGMAAGRVESTLRGGQFLAAVERGPRSAG